MSRIGEVNKAEFILACSKSKSSREVINALGYKENGTKYKLIKNLSDKWNIPLPQYVPSRKYKIVHKLCPVCFKLFTTSLGNKNEKTVCSHSCSNTYFRSGENNGNWGSKNYRNICFNHHKKQCCVCGFTHIVEVHHYDHNRENNDISNLIPLCPNHHAMYHSRHIAEVKPIVDEYKNQISV